MGNPSPSRLGDFTAFDLETSGLEFRKGAEIIECGAVRIRGGDVVERFSELVRPEGPVPKNILQLTGIDEARLRRARSLREVLPDFLEFLGSDVLVGHNVDFDLDFTRHYAEREGLDFREAGSWDTLGLAQMLLPTLANHRLATVALRLGVSLEGAHRACEDAEASGRVLLELRRRALGLPDHLLAELRELCAGTGSRQEGWLEGLAADAERAPLESLHACELVPRGDCRAPVYEREGIPGAPPATAEHWFGEQGRLARAIEGFKPRAMQQEMATAVAEGFREGRFQAVEAATGTGKSFAYLLPALLEGRRLRANDLRGVVVSTNTRNLQEQLFHKDLPLLGSALEQEFSAVLLKGRANYICGRRWQSLRREAPVRLGDAERLKLLPIVLWLEVTQSGDIEECSAFHHHANRSLWAQLQSDTRHCRSAACRTSQPRGASRPAEPPCFLSIVRRRAQQAELVVVNHNLLLSDLGVDGAILGDYAHLVLDEAHNLCRTAESQLRREFSLPETARRLASVYDARREGRGLLRQLRNRLLDPALAGEQGARLLPLLEDLAAALADLQEELETFWQRFNSRQREEHEETIRVQRYTLKRRVTREHNPLLFFHEEIRTLLSRRGGLTLVGRPLLENLDELGQGESAFLEEAAELQAQLQGLQEALGELETLVDHGEGEEVAWYEIHPGTMETRFFLCPLKVGQTLAAQLYPRLQSLLLTSATLAVDGRFDYLLASTGLADCERETRCITLGTPFDYPRQARVYIPTWLPDPSARNRQDFCSGLAELVAELSSRYEKGTLLLFTSYAFLNATYDELRKRLDTRRIPLLGQGKDGSRSDLLEAFRASGRGILLGTDSFWEGIDVPGEALQLLVMTKLPFEVPNEPMVEARCKAIEAAGGNAFMEQSVPEAVIRFRQGFGRLIRHEGDRGIFLLLDQRVIQKRYGSRFTGSLPVEAKSFFDGRGLLRSVDNFWSKG